MDLSYSAEHEAFRGEVRQFLAQNWRAGEAATPEDERAFRSLATEHGYLYRNIPRRYGGSEQPVDLLRGEIVREEFQRAGAPMEVAGSGIGLFTPTLLQWGAEWQKEMFIPPTVRGEFKWCQGYSEPGAGSDLASLRTRAELVGDKWIINGQKVWTSYARQADHMFMLARTEPDAPKHSGISYLILDMRQPGIEVRPLRQIDGNAQFNEVFFTDAETPADWIVGERGRGWEVSRTTLKHERSNLNGINYHMALFKSLVEAAKRTQRNGKPAIEDPIIRDRLARLEGWILATKYSSFRNLSMAAAGQDPGIFPLLMKLNGSNLAREAYLISREFIGDDFLLSRPGDDGVGRRQNRVWSRMPFTSMHLAIAGGASNIQRNIIAERGLGLPRDSQMK
ncbi:MAG: acyl-CoA dehydrogenase family protein [Caulobacteraceae bacterium]|nr:acyl-CoA dehydrogenase family protein [Caulobacteraceae bacterium]